MDRKSMIEKTNFKKFVFGDYFFEKTGYKNEVIRKVGAMNSAKRFDMLVDTVVSALNQELIDSDKEQNITQVRDRHNKARAGGEKEVNYYKGKVQEYLKSNNLSESDYPKFYPNLVEAVFQEGWGFCGLHEWLYSLIYKYSSSAKIIGEKIYFMNPKTGQMELMEQRISLKKLNRLIDNLYAMSVEKVRQYESDHLYIDNGLERIRVQVFDRNVTKPGQISLVFRKYIIDELSFEEQAKRGTIEPDSVEMMKNIVQFGANSAVTGPIRSGKTTFLTTMEMYEEEMSEAVMIESDPEVPMHRYRPNSPYIQLLADSPEKVKSIVAQVMRSDGTRLLVMEARDPLTCDVALQVSAKGTRGVKMTYHVTEPAEMINEMADSINKYYGNTNKESQVIQVAKSFNYIFHLKYLQNQSKKRLDVIYEIDYDPINLTVSLVPICKYDDKKDSWTFNEFLSERLEIAAELQSKDALMSFKRELARLASDKPMSPEDARPLDLTYLRKGVADV